METLAPLPSYPSTNLRKSLAPSQISQINKKIYSGLAATAALPPAKRDTPATRSFISAYARDAALQFLQNIIWKNEDSNQAERLIKKRTLILAEKLSSSLEIEALVDLAIVYGPTSASRVQKFFLSSLAADSTLPTKFEEQVVHAFTSLLSPSQASGGLYGLRKTAHIIFCVLKCSPPEILRTFSRNKPFLMSLADVYEEGLGTLGRSYGGLNTQGERDLDEWEQIWLETKVAVIDAFHLLIVRMLEDLSSASGSTLINEMERTFDIIFALLDRPTPFASGSGTEPFLNQSILADYQSTYDLSHTLSDALKHAADKDARLDMLEHSLSSLGSASEKGQGRGKNPGALKLLLRSSGIPHGINHTGKSKGKQRASSPPSPSLPNRAQAADDIEIETQITQVLDILPSHTHDYIRLLLTGNHPGYPWVGCGRRGEGEAGVESVISALLEGNVPTEDELRQHNSGPEPTEELIFTKGRRNVFEDDLDLDKVHFGKKSQDADLHIVQDRAYIEQMKADILRRAEAIAMSDEEDENFEAQKPNPLSRSTFGDDESDDDLETGHVRVIGGGEESDASSGDEEGEEGEVVKATPVETILELAYISDPKLFDRDAQTRRGKGREALRTATGWKDEQIEGWRIMLEKNPKKDKILMKHEFSGNRSQTPPAPIAGPSRGSAPRGRGGGGGGRGRGGGGGGGGRGRGGASGSGSGGGDGNSTRERAWKDKNKASRANHDRKRGHDKKMARAGGPS